MDAHRTYVTGPASNGWQRESLRRYQAGCHDCDWRGPWHGGGSDDGPCGEAARAVARRDADEHAGAGATHDYSEVEHSGDFVRVACECGHKGEWRYANAPSLQRRLHSDINAHVWALKRMEADR
jgi:hypothetical protein